MFSKKKTFKTTDVIVKSHDGIYDKYWLKVINIWTDYNIIIKKIEYVCNILNQKYLKEKIRFFIDPSYERWFAVSVFWLNNEHWASLRIIQDNDFDLKKTKTINLFWNKINSYFSFLWYDIIHKKEKDLLIEAAVIYMNLK